MKIITEQAYNGPYLVWEAIDDSTYDMGEPVGRGATEQEAIEDLLWLLEERNDAKRAYVDPDYLRENRNEYRSIDRE